MALCALAALSLTGAAIILFESGRDMSRLFALVALLMGGIAISACLTAMLRLTADPSQEP